MRWRAKAPDPGWLLAMGAVGITVAYGVARAASVGFKQLRDAVFARVAQRALRRWRWRRSSISTRSLRYHITRKTGGLSRIIERGVKGVEFLLRFLLFSVGPLILELHADRHRARLGSSTSPISSCWSSPSRSISGSPSR
jgi:hypothetical protein